MYLKKKKVLIYLFFLIFFFSFLFWLAVWVCGVLSEKNLALFAFV